MASDLTELAKSVTMKYYRPGSRIVKQDDDADHFFIIMQGKVLVTYKLAEKDKAGLFFGKKIAV